MRRTTAIWSLISVAVVVIAIFIFIASVSSKHTPPTYGGGVSNTTTTTTSPNTTTTVFTSGPSGAQGINVVGSVEWTAAQWVNNFYSVFYKWPNLLYGENVLAAKFETPAFAASVLHNGANTTSVASKEEWTLVTTEKDGMYPFITSASVPLGAGTCAIHCVVAVNWTYATLSSTGASEAPSPNGATAGVSVILTKTGSKWLVSAPAGPVGN